MLNEIHRFRVKSVWSLMVLFAGCVGGRVVPSDVASETELGPAATSHSKGRVVRAGTKKYQTAKTYDLAGRIINTVHTIEGVSYGFYFQYGYTGGAENSGEFGPRVVATIYPDGERLESDVDAVGSTQRVVSSLHDANSGQVYRDELSGRKKLNPYGQVEWQDLGNGTRTYSTYDSTRRLSKIVTLRLRDDAVLQAFEYRYDKAGRMTAVHDFCSWVNATPICCDPRDASCEKREQSADYSYDVAGWLKTVRMNGVAQEFNANAIGNLTEKTESFLEYTDAKHPHAVTQLKTRNGLITGAYSYNAVGSMTRMEEDGVVTETKWNFAEMPVETRRGTGVTKRFYMGETLYKREDTVHGETFTSIFLPGLRVEHDTYRKNYGFAERESKPSEGSHEARRGTLRFFHANHLGSSTLVTDAEGVPAHRAVYAPFGEELRKDGAYTPKQGFTGKEKENISGLFDYGARLYNPRIGRFVSADSVMDGLNPYSYVYNNPVNFVDPTGHQGEKIKPVQADREYVYDHGTDTYYRPEELNRSEMRSYSPSRSERAYSKLCEWDPRGLCSNLGQMGRYYDNLKEHGATQPILLMLGFVPGWTGAMAGVADAQMYGGNIWFAGIIGGLGAFNPKRTLPILNPHIAKGLLWFHPFNSGWSSTFIAGRIHFAGKNTGYVNKTVKFEVFDRHLNVAQRHKLASEIADAMNALREELPFVSKTMLHPNRPATLIQEEVIGFEKKHLSGQAAINARWNMDRAILAAQNFVRNNGLKLRVDNIADDNFRFDAQGNIVGWFDPFYSIVTF